jgi:hypothetical protein
MAYRTAIVAHDAETDSMIGKMKVASLVIITPRLRLRQFRREDAEPFCAMTAESQVFV